MLLLDYEGCKFCEYRKVANSTNNQINLLWHILDIMKRAGLVIGYVCSRYDQYSHVNFTLMNKPSTHFELSYALTTGFLVLRQVESSFLKLYFNTPRS